MELKELLRLDNKTILSGSDVNGNRYLGMMLKHYSEIFGQSCFSCSKQFPVYLNQLRQLSMSDKKTIFKLKKGVSVPIFGTSEAYSNSNLTDEASLKILSRNPNAIAVFEKYPKDWKELVEAYKLSETEIKTIEEVAQLSVAQIRILFPEAKGRSREDLLKSIAELYPELGKSNSQENDPGGQNDDPSENDPNNNGQDGDPE